MPPYVSRMPHRAGTGRSGRQGDAPAHAQTDMRKGPVCPAMRTTKGGAMRPAARCPGCFVLRGKVIYAWPRCSDAAIARRTNDPVAKAMRRRRERPSVLQGSRVSRPGVVPNGREALPRPEGRGESIAGRGRPTVARDRALSSVDGPPKYTERRATTVPLTGEDRYRSMAGVGMRPFHRDDTGPWGLGGAHAR